MGRQYLLRVDRKTKLDSDVWSLAGDGKYVLMECGTSRYLGVRTWEIDADCTPPTTDRSCCRTAPWGTERSMGRPVLGWVGGPPRDACALAPAARL